MNLLRFIYLLVILTYLVLYYCISSLIPLLWSIHHFISIISSSSVLLVKIGQILSVRPDICGDKLAIILSELRKDVTPVNMDLYNILDVNIKSRLCSIDIEPLACGSVAQVYTAYIMLNNSTEKVIFKILKQHAINQINKDLDIAKSLAKIIDYFKPMWHASKCLDEIGSYILKQTDFNLEKGNIELFRKRGYNVPIVYNEMCRNNILCMEYIESYSYTKEEKNKMFLKLCNKMMTAPLLLHMDLHPANVIWSKKGPYLIDLGLTQLIPENIYLLFIKAILTLHTKNYDEFALLFLKEEQEVPIGWVEFISSVFPIKINTSSVIQIFIAIIRNCHKYKVSIDERMSGLVMTIVIINGHYDNLNDGKKDFLQQVLF